MRHSHNTKNVATMFGQNLKNASTKMCSSPATLVANILIAGGMSAVSTVVNSAIQATIDQAITNKKMQKVKGTTKLTEHVEDTVEVDDGNYSEV